MDFALLFGIAWAGALASPLGGAIALCKRPSSLALSIAVGFAAGARGCRLRDAAARCAPRAARNASLPLAVAGFAVGFAGVYAPDLFVQRGVSAGAQAAQRDWVRSVQRRRPPRGDEVTVLAGGTSAEELIEGLSLGVSAATDPGLGVTVGVAILLDNLSEALSIGELIRAKGGQRQVRRIFGWTTLVGASLFTSAMAGWFLLRNLSSAVLGVLLAIGDGAMFYLTFTQLVPEAESHQFEESSAIAAGTGLLLIFTLSRLAAA